MGRVTQLTVACDPSETASYRRWPLPTAEGDSAATHGRCDLCTVATKKASAAMMMGYRPYKAIAILRGLRCRCLGGGEKGVSDCNVRLDGGARRGAWVARRDELWIWVGSVDMGEADGGRGGRRTYVW
ncbi:hypothetical protein TIFTF001_017327 [Ficus carica]|uniref:Uncharacterized protein n=1 Tax=Ficus carica TaxID=3494 RepID=A0AA88AQJ0_FICCA|nr:hypothetical protein TIFTF001_017327 [Ficus carica]